MGGRTFQIEEINYIVELTNKNMKKIAFILSILIFASSCASHRCHGVGDTPHSRKSQKASQQKTYSQFPF